MAEKNLPAQIKKSTSSDNRIRIGIGQEDGSVEVQGVRIQAGFLGGVPFDAGQSLALVRQDKTWLVLGVVYPGSTQAVHYQAGTETINFAGVSSFSTPVVFARPFASVPAVVANINSPSGTANLWFTRCHSVTVNGFTLLVSAGAINTWTNITVQWQAQIQTQ